MAGERSFLVRILGNSDGAVAAFKKLAKEGKESIDQVRDVAGKMGDAFDVVKKGAFIALGAFTAVAGAATAAALAAAKDEESQRLLASALERTTGATADQITQVENFINKSMRATGITDDELRPAFANLARATGDVTESQRLFNLALDISAATGRDLSSVTIALGKSSEGQVASLQKLGIPLDENVKKSKDFGAAISFLEGQFGGSAATAADTFSGRLKILQTGLGEAIESIGYALLPFFERFVELLQKYVVPAVQAFADNVGEKGIGDAVGYALNALGDLGPSFVDLMENMTIAVLTFLEQFVGIARNIALTVELVGALTGNVALTLKAAAASLTFKYAQDRLNDAIAAAPGKFDALRASMARAAAATATALPKIIGTADALERIASKTKKSTEETTTAIGGSAKTVETAKEKLEKYTSAMSSATSAQKSLTQAQKSGKSAQADLTKANESLATAQENFNKITAGFGADSKEAKAAQRDLDKAQRSLAQAGFRVEEAVFAVADAEKELAKVRADPESTPQMIREAEIRLAQAKLSVSDATDSQRDATDSLTKAQNMLNEAVDGAVEGSDTYNQFLKILEDAKERQIDASDRAKEAAERETEALEALVEAIKKVAEAAKFNPNLFVPVLPTVPAPTLLSGGGGFTGRPEQGGQSIVINTGLGTNGVEAGRQIVEVLQQYSKLDRNAIADLVVTR